MDFAKPLSHLQEMIGEDYSLELSSDGQNRYVLTVLRGAEACAECVVPDEFLASLLQDELTRAGFPVQAVEVRHRNV